MTEIALVALQLTAEPADVVGNLERLMAEVRRIGSAADLIVAPELALTGYDLDLVADRGREIAERLDGPSVNALSALATEVDATLVVGLLELLDDALYDTAVVISPHGETGAYRKSHLYPPETVHFAAGDELVTVATPAGLLGPLICFEHAFPEAAATLALAGAQVLAIPSAVPVGYEHLLHVRNRARAQDNQVFVVASNATGHGFCGESMIVGPDGAVLAHAGREPTCLLARVDLDDIEAERRREPALGLRREPLYRDATPPRYVTTPAWTPASWPKPVDVGSGTQAASFGLDGRWLSLGAAHPRHGYVELSNAPDFDESRRGDPAYVREYREGLTAPSSAFLIAEPAPTGTGRTLSLGDDGPHWSSDCGARDVTSTCNDDAWIVQRQRLSARSDRPAGLTLTFHGRLRRASFGEITEVAPPPPVESTTVYRCAGTTLNVIADGLDATATIDVTIHSGHSNGWQPIGPGAARLVASADGDLDIAVAANLSVPGVDAAPGGSRSHRALDDNGLRQLTVIVDGDGRDGLVVPAGAIETLQRITAGAVRYTLGCCVCPVAPAEAAILTDHRLLPLSWTRDAYYQAVLLLSVRRVVRAAAPTVADHLRWLWERARQPGVGWLRAHYAHGAVKDPVPQADQQLYPLLELLDFRRLVGRWPQPSAQGATARAWWGDRVSACWEELPRHHPTGLLPATENPADDPLELPVLLSSQILYWYVASWLALFADELDLDRQRFAAAADRIRATTESVFACDGPAGSMWAYATDGTRTSTPYVDANDLPTALAPLWGFCRADEPRWVGTMRFAWSSANPGYARGPFGGLGSRHTPGTWPLGDLQEWIAASLLSEPSRVGRVFSRVDRVAAADGMLPESYDPDTGQWLARHWFVWPGAAFGALTQVAVGALDLTVPSAR